MRFEDELSFNGLRIPMRIYVERRSNSRASFTTKGINLRLPRHLGQKEIDKQIEWGKNWARNQIIKKPSIGYRYVDRSYKEGSIIPVYDQKYIIEYNVKPMIKPVIKISDNKFIIDKPAAITLHQKSIKKAIIKLLNSNYHFKIDQRVRHINDLSVKKHIKRITLKYLKSQWGNCSTNGDIKLSTRILLLPERIQNAIIMHELTHLVHFDHSPAFYNTLQSHMPDYKARDKWLKEYEGTIDF